MIVSVEQMAVETVREAPPECVTDKTLVEVQMRGPGHTVVSVGTDYAIDATADLSGCKKGTLYYHVKRSPFARFSATRVGKGLVLKRMPEPATVTDFAPTFSIAYRHSGALCVSRT
jgi:hypothetical protein